MLDRGIGLFRVSLKYVVLSMGMVLRIRGTRLERRREAPQSEYVDIYKAHWLPGNMMD
jgi:hypothetical protein